MPPGVESVRVTLDVICDKPAAEAAGYLTYGNNSVALVNWATCLMYPEGPSADETRVDATLTLPPQWEFACALEVGRTTTGTGAMMGKATDACKSVEFRPVSLTELVDNPVIAGEHLRTIPLETGPYPPAYLDLVSESASALQVSPEVVGIYSPGRRGRPAPSSAPAIIRRSTSWSRAATIWAISGSNTSRAVDQRSSASATCSTRDGFAAGSPTCCLTNTSTPGAASSDGRPACARLTSRPRTRPVCSGSTRD